MASTTSKLHDGDLQRLHSADEVAANWLDGMAMKALTRQIDYTHTHTPD